MTPSSADKTPNFDVGYAWAVLGVGLAAVLRQLLEPVLEGTAPLLGFMLPVALVALYCGKGPGVLATLLGAAVGISLFVGPLRFAPMTRAELVGTGLFITIGLVVSALAGRLALAREDLQTSIEQLRRAASQKDEFIAVLGHELRNPLAAVHSALVLMGAARLDEARHAAAGDIASRQLGNVYQLLDQLLDLSRLNLGLTACAQQPVDLVEVVYEAREQCDPLLAQQQVTLACQLPSEPVMVIGDRLRLVQLLANILANAGKYTPPGGHVEVALQTDQQQALLSVHDNGRGIAAELMPHVFTSFVQEPRSLAHARGGLGLGLSVVKKIATLHGGRVTAQSAGAGQGSRFVVELPLAPQRGRMH